MGSLLDLASHFCHWEWDLRKNLNRKLKSEQNLAMGEMGFAARTREGTRHVQRNNPGNADMDKHKRKCTKETESKNNARRQEKGAGNTRRNARRNLHVRGNVSGKARAKATGRKNHGGTPGKAMGTARLKRTKKHTKERKMYKEVAWGNARGYPLKTQELTLGEGTREGLPFFCTFPHVFPVYS